MAIPREVQLVLNQQTELETVQQTKSVDVGLAVYGDQSTFKLIKPILPPKEHEWVWEGYMSTPTRQCRICGLSEELDPFMQGKGTYVYIGAMGDRIMSFIPLSCPAHNVSGAELMERARPVKQRVGNVEEAVETLHERLTNLESENALLREQVNADRADVRDFVNWLAEMVKEHTQRGGPSVELVTKGQTFLLPEPVATIITTIGSVQKDTEVIEAELLDPIKSK